MPQDKETPNSNNATVAVTKQDLADIVAAAVTAAIAAAKAPTVVEQAQLDAEAKRIKDEQESRKQLSKGVLDQIENKRFIHQTCSHEHKNGDTHCVYIQEKVGPGYLLCQKNQCIIRPGQASENYKGVVIYNTEMFNRIFQKTTSAGEIFG